jgi:hypothetical protein
MKTPLTLQLNPAFGPMLFADCPFCLQPVPLDVATGTMDCPACDVRLELAEEEALPLASAA